MSELGYYEQIQGGIFGTPDAGDPATRAALQESVAQQQIARAAQPGYIPPGYGGAGYRAGGPSNYPTPGWTVQNAHGAQPFGPYSAADMGVIPDWTGDANPIGAGAYDQTQLPPTGAALNNLNRAPAGPNEFEQMAGDYPNPNTLPEDVSGTIDLEW